MSGARPVRRAMFIALMICAAAWVVSLAGFPALAGSSWMQGIFLAIAAVVTLQSSARVLPAQNVIAVAGIITLITGMALLAGAKTGIPFGPRTFATSLDPQLFDVLPWSLPVLWVVVILNSRGVARLILRPWRKVARYGYWSICLTVLLTVALDFSLEPFAALVSQWWIWRTPNSAVSWYTAPWVNFLGLTVTTIIALAFAMPWLIEKRAGRSSAPDYRVLGTWLVLNLVPAAGCALNQFWWAAAFGVVAPGIVAYYAIRGARW